MIRVQVLDVFHAVPDLEHGLGVLRVQTHWRNFIYWKLTASYHQTVGRLGGIDFWRIRTSHTRFTELIRCWVLPHVIHFRLSSKLSGVRTVTFDVGYRALGSSRSSTFTTSKRCVPRFLDWFRINLVSLDRPVPRSNPIHSHNSYPSWNEFTTYSQWMWVSQLIKESMSRHSERAC